VGDRRRSVPGRDDVFPLAMTLELWPMIAASSSGPGPGTRARRALSPRVRRARDLLRGRKADHLCARPGKLLHRRRPGTTQSTRRSRSQISQSTRRWAVPFEEESCPGGSRREPASAHRQRTCLPGERPAHATWDDCFGTASMGWPSAPAPERGERASMSSARVCRSRRRAAGELLGRARIRVLASAGVKSCSSKTGSIASPGEGHGNHGARTSSW